MSHATPDPAEGLAPPAQVEGMTLERMQAMLDHSWDVLTLMDAEGRLIFNSSAAQRLHGFTREEMAGRNTFDFIHPEDQAKVGEVFQHCLASPDLPVRVEYRYARKHGAWIWMEAVAVNLLHSAPVHAIVVNSRDISERKQAEEERRSLERQLQQSQKMESLGRLAGGVAHDMNNVLASILGLASLHEEQLPPGHPSRRAFEIIGFACHRGGDLVKRLLAFARQGLAEMRPVELNQMLREEVHLLERTIPPQVRLSLDLAPDLAPIQGDLSALSLTVMNLCVNALDAMPDGGELVLRTRNTASGWVEVDVEDTGTGMPREVLDQALSPFFTTKPFGKGTGLGLAIAYNTLLAHHGTLDLASEPGRGTRVTLAFPASPAEDQVPAAPVVSSTTHDAGPLEVLLVDDDPVVRDTIAAMVRGIGHGITTAERGEAALSELAHGTNPDLVILDLNMPGIGGAETLARIRRMDPRLPVLIATGRADQGAQALMEMHSCVGLLPKPFSLAGLRAAIHALLERCPRP